MSIQISEPHPARLRKVVAILGGAALLAISSSVHAAKADKPEKPGKNERSEKADKSEKTDKSARGTAAAASTARGGDFDPFRVIVDRNIFNPNRTSRSRPADETPPLRIDSFALVGTLESDNGLVAIFDGSSEKFRAALSIGGEIAGFKVTKIQPAAVELTAGDKTQTVRMSQQLRRTEGGEWRVSGRDLARAEFARAENDSTKDRNAGAPVIPANASDVVRRLMEQRQKQLKQ